MPSGVLVPILPKCLSSQHRDGGIDMFVIGLLRSFNSRQLNKKIL